MTDRTITLRADLVSRLESLAQHQGRSLDDVFTEMLNNYAVPRRSSWASEVAEAMEAAPITWMDDVDASHNSRNAFTNHLRARWESG
jgi:predicted transcriptional regulator